MKIKFKYRYAIKFFNEIIILFTFIFFLIILFFSLFKNKDQEYKLFVQFNSVHRLKEGASVNFRGVKIGYVKNLNIQLNSVIALLNINSTKILLPRDCVIEVNQLGLFNDVVIDIIPLKSKCSVTLTNIDVLSDGCLKSSFICSNFYVKGYKGLNYDDLVRSTTRISQRFDDPRFFDLFYLFLQSSLEISDQILLLLNYYSYSFYYFSNFIQLASFKYLY
uniref:Mce/MlaD domain-containing protein n=1 Tax=Dasyclonium flaccidum TaxID=2007274 RepID=A0A1Z1MLF5_9FLOR|nr:hypothetical protein [Dasyclonium flaccidum]ARW66581.1 hypothetical protein [Dasyclonium flaccidum]